MKIDRLIAIIVTLIRKKRISARELADMFDVSVRTIYRDVDTINQAGIPIITYPGMNGGIGIAEGYKLDRNVLSNNELAAIVTALQGISTTPGNVNNHILLEKLKSSVPQSHLEAFNLKTQQFLVDLSMWGRNEILEGRIEKLKTAIEQSKQVVLDYCTIKGETTTREVEPYTLILKGQKWYLYAYCKKRNDFRLFKLSRIMEIRNTGTVFERREINLDELPWNTEWNYTGKMAVLTLLFDKEVKTAIEEWFGIENVSPCPDGKYLVKASLPEDNWLYGFILSFGNHVEVIEPEYFREALSNIAHDIIKIYER